MYEPFVSGCCPYGENLINEKCVPWLGCDELQKLKDNSTFLANGKYKDVYKVQVEDTPLALLVAREDPGKLNLTRATKIKVSNSHIGVNLQNLIFYQPYEKVARIYGFCMKKEEKSMLLMELADRSLETTLKSKKRYVNEFPFSRRLDLALSFLETLHFKHHSPIGALTNCDTNQWLQLARQSLVIGSTIIENDLGMAWPTNDQVSACAHKYPKGEELWKVDDIQPPEGQHRVSEWNEKAKGRLKLHSDIWRIPNVTQNILFPEEDEIWDQHCKILNMLEKINKEIRQPNMFDRPSIDRVYTEYKKVFDKYRKNL